MAPVSIGALACMLPAQALANRLPRRFCVSGFAARKRPETLAGCTLQPLLPPCVVFIDVAFLQPFLGRQIHSR